MGKTDTASPCLVNPYGEDKDSQAVYNICEPNNSSCKKSIPELKGKSFYQKNRHQGWLVVVCDDKEFDYTPRKHGDCFLFNPLSMETIKLPSFLNGIHWLQIYLRDCLLTSPPKTSTRDGDWNCMVFMLLIAYDHLKGILLYCHPGDREWKSHIIGDKYNVGDLQSMCYFNGKLHIMCRGFNHLEINIQSKNKPETLSIRIIKIRIDIQCGFLGHTRTTYYVESSDGGIFMIEKYYNTRGVYEYSYMLTIGKLDLSSMSWVEVTSLDDHVFILDRTTRLSCSAKDLGFSRGCVYFTQPIEMSLYKYDLDDNSIMLSLPCPDLPNPWFSANLLMIPKTLRYVKELRIQEKRGVAENISCDGSEVLKTMLSRISLKSDDEKADVEEARPCWVLEDDMVWSISNYLNPVDNIHFRAVCKTYRSIIPLLHRRRSAKCLQDTNLSPWLVFSKNSEAVYSFINPMHNNENYLMSIPELLKGSTIRYSKGGWLLMSKGYDRLFFYNPFTKAFIKLPDLPAGVYGYSYRGISFSSLPTSSDCVVFAIKDYLYAQVEISLIKRGDGKWTNDVFGEHEWTNIYRAPEKKFEPSLNSPVFYDGAFYCLDLNGTLGVCTLRNGIRWEILSMVPPPDCDFIYTSYLVEFEGKLLSVLSGHYGKWVRCFRLDFAKMAWIEVEHLGRLALFISNTSCIARTAPTSQMENKIYFPRLRNEGILFYSLDSGRYHSLGSEHSSTDYCNSKHNLWCSWIEPNWLEIRQPDFDWS